MYTDSIETFMQVTRNHAARVAEVLRADPVCQGGYLPVACRRDEALAHVERDYLWYAAGVACAIGAAGKMLCQKEDEGRYWCYFSQDRSAEILAALSQFMAVLESEGELRFKTASQDVFGGVKGSYYWAKCLLEHMVYLRAAHHQDQWGVRL